MGLWIQGAIEESTQKIFFGLAAKEMAQGTVV